MKLSKDNLFIKAWQFAKGDAYEYPTNWCSLTWLGIVGILMLALTAVPGLIYVGIMYILAKIVGSDKPDWYDFYCTKALFWVALLHSVASIPIASIIIEEVEGTITITSFFYYFVIAFLSLIVVVFAIFFLGYLVSEYLPKRFKSVRISSGKLGEGVQAVWHGLKKLKDDYCPLIEYENEKK